ncbi:hypothetical protein RRG08_014463 [Elysia crispata]|uniref:Uncharacterized protein n=1 Tax=Elysia crispata TaxID=231223 RepID=A0AAE1CSW8_9GAST|nr:hypothetical protein RRG08_014463 [Elysia crispata]
MFQSELGISIAYNYPTFASCFKVTPQYANVDKLLPPSQNKEKIDSSRLIKCHSREEEGMVLMKTS